MLQRTPLFAIICLFALNAASLLAQQPLLSIAEARRQSLGSLVRVAGRVSSAAELGTTSYLQDATGGLAVFNTSFTSGTAIGDSVEITGPLSEFQATTGVVGSGLLQISGSGVTWRVIPANRIPPEARIIRLREIQESLESQVVRVSNVQFADSGVFRGNTNYIVSDGSTTAQVRISNGTSLVNSAIPRGRVAVTGLLGQFRGTYQITPRFVAEVGTQSTANPFDTIPKSRTFDITTWNVKWFGRPRDNDGVTVLGPADSLLQLRNVIRVMDSIDSEIYAIQEVSNSALFRRIQDSLPRYGVVIADGIQPPQPQFTPQRTAFVFKKSALDTLQTRLLLTNTQFAAGRFPFRLDIRVRTSAGLRLMSFIVIHAKAGATQRDYELRTTDAEALYNELRPQAVAANIVVLGDFNDALTTSTFNNQPTPYQVFVRDSVNFFPATISLSRQGLSSFASGTTMLDNVVTTRYLRQAVIQGAEKIETTAFIPSYVSTTSDHYPVTVRLLAENVLPEIVINVRENKSVAAGLSAQISPNPASDRATVRFVLPKADVVRCSVVNVLGQEVMRLPEAFLQTGEQTALLDVNTLPPGVYQCRLQAGMAVQYLPIIVSR